MAAKRFPFLLLLPLLAFTSLACGALDRIDSGRQTAVAFATNVQEGRETADALVTSVRGLATEGSELLDTAQAFATQNPETAQTAQSFFTTQGPALLASAEAFATENPSLLQTARALVTSVPGVVGTAASGIISGSTSSLHPDIPVLPESQRLSYIENETSVIYSTQYLTRRGVEDFYMVQMPVYDWRYVPGESQEAENWTIQVFQKDNRTAQVIILPIDAGITSITVSISTQ